MLTSTVQSTGLGTNREIIDYFHAVMPQYTMQRLLKETNKELSDRDLEILTHTELLRFFGVCLLITQFDFDNCRDLWMMATGSNYMVPPNLAAMGMSRHRFTAGCLSARHVTSNIPFVVG
jgi:hypothetical protein